MEFIFEHSTREDAVAAFARACRVAALKDEAWNQSVEGRIVVIAIEAVLKKRTGREGCLLGKELEEDVA